MSDLHDSLVHISVLRELIRYHDPTIDDRIIQWCLLAVNKDWVAQHIQDRPKPYQLWFLKGMLPDAAIPVLERRLEETWATYANAKTSLPTQLG